MAELSRVDHGNAATANNLQIVARTDKRRGVLIKANTDGKRVVGQRRQQSAQAIALAEVEGPAQGLAALEPLKDAKPLASYPYFYAAKADLLDTPKGYLFRLTLPAAPGSGTTSVSEPMP